MAWLSREDYRRAKKEADKRDTEYTRNNGVEDYLTFYDQAVAEIRRSKPLYRNKRR